LAGGGSGAAISAAAGGGLGYVVGNEEDKEDAKEQAAQERAALQKAHITKDPQTAYRPPNENPLAGSTWRVIISLVSGDQIPDYHSMVVTFQSNTKLTTLTVLGNNKTEISIESYRVVNDVLVITGKGYVINAKYSVEGKRMIVVAPQLKVVLEEVEEKI